MGNNIKITKGNSGVDELPSGLGYRLNATPTSFTIPKGLPVSTSCYGMFNYCYRLASLDLSNFDTSKVTNMSGMFNYCSSLTSLNLSNLDTSRVTDMSSMFFGCSSLTSLDLSNFDFSSVNSSALYYMLYTRGTCTVYVKSEADKTKLTSYASPTSGVTIVVKS